MATVTDWYVDPLSGDNATGDGTSDGTAWQTIQYAFDNLTQTVNGGDVVNVKDSATITLTADLDWSSLTANLAYPVCVRGYTSTAGDGGYAVIDQDGFGFCSSLRHYIQLQNLHIQNTGAAKDFGVYIGIRSVVKECKFSNYSTGGTENHRVLRIGNSASLVTISNNEFTDCDGSCIQGQPTSCSITGNHFYNSGTREIDNCIFTSAGTKTNYSNNIFNLDSGSNGIKTSSTGTNGLWIVNNTFFTSGTGDGIICSHNNYGSVVENNIFEGWDKAVDFGNGLSRPGASIAHNHFYDNTTDIDSTTHTTFMFDYGNFKAALASVLSKSGSNTHANRAEYFKPTGDAVAGSVNGLSSMGAVQLLSAGGGGSSAANPFGKGLVI